uniref:Uncharacterized protein n=1 Tax=Arundo donax TaxID=35708 RepID=A0A0A9B9C1_ARUDO
MSLLIRFAGQFWKVCYGLLSSVMLTILYNAGIQREDVQIISRTFLFSVMILGVSSFNVT